MVGFVLERRSAEADLVAVRIAVGDLADAVPVRLAGLRLDATGTGGLGERVEVTHEQRLHGVAGVLRLELDVEEAVLGELPDRLGVVRHERRVVAQQTAVPVLRDVEVAHVHAGEEVDFHPDTLARWIGATR